MIFIKRFFIVFVVSVLCQVHAQQTLENSSVEAYFKNGLEMFQNKHYASAEQLFDNYLNHKDISPITINYMDAEYYSAICDLYLYHSNAETKISQFVEKYPLYPKSIRANFDLACFYYDNKKFDKAITFFEKVNVTSLDKSESIDYKFKLAYCYLMGKNYAKAALFNEVKVLESSYKETATYYAGFVNNKNANYAEAEKDLAMLLESKNFKEIVPALYLSVLNKQKKYTTSIAYTQKLDSNKVAYKQPDDVNLLTGDACYNLKNYKSAVGYFDKVSFIAKSQPDTAFKYGYSLYEQEQYPKSIEMFKTITSKNLLGQYAAFYLGMAYLKTNNKQFALTAFTQAAEMKFDSSVVRPKALFYQGKVNFDLHNFDEAVQNFKRFNDNFPKHELIDEANGLLGESFLNSNNYQEAIKYIEKLPRKTDRVLASYQKVTFYKAMELYNDNKIDLALEFLDKSLENQKTVSFTQKAYYWKGEGLSFLKMYTEARESYLAIPLGDEFISVKSYYGLGYTYYFQKKYADAKKYFEKYIANHAKDKNQANYIDAIIRVGDCKYIAKQYDESVEEYNKALALNPTADVDYILFQKGSVLEIQEKYEGAITNYELLIRRFPNSVFYDNALFQKGNIEFVKNNFDPAIALFSKLITEKPDSKILPMALMLRGKSYKNSDKVELSIPDLKQIIIGFPNSSVVKEAMQELQESYSRLDRDAEFDAVMEEFNEKNPAHSDLEKLQYQTAFNAYNAKKMDFAIIKMKSFIDKYPNSTYNPDFEYYIANAYLSKNDTNNALTYFNIVIDDNESDFVIDAVNALAKIELNRNHLEKSNALYMRLMKMSMSQTDILQAQIGLMDNYYKTQTYDSSKAYSNRVLNSGSKNATLINRAGLIYGKSMIGLKDTMGALSQYMTMLNTTQDEYGAEANYLAAELFYLTKQYKQSIDKIYYLKEKYKNYKEWYYKSFILLTDNYLAMNEVFQAKAILKSIISKSKDKDFVDKAKVKLDYIEQNYTIDEDEE